MPDQLKWDKMFIKMAIVASEMSKDPNTQVGAVLVSNDNRKISFGYNGFVRGIEETKCKCEKPHKYQYVMHAELNAVINCPFDTIGCTLYCTHQPCHRCLETIAQAGIRRVIYDKTYIGLECTDIWVEHSLLFDEVSQIISD
jgi:dCMP deaminase